MRALLFICLEFIKFDTKDTSCYFISYASQYKQACNTYIWKPKE